MPPWYNDIRNPWPLTLLIVVSFVGMLLYAHFTQEPVAAQAQARLENEFKAIPPFPGAISTYYSAIHKESIAIVQGAYRTGADYKEIRSYYGTQLSAQGWRYCGETGTTGQFQLTVSYRKQDLDADVYLATSPSRQGDWVYAIAMSWYRDPALRTHCE